MCVSRKSALHAIKDQSCVETEVPPKSEEMRLGECDTREKMRGWLDEKINSTAVHNS